MLAYKKLFNPAWNFNRHGLLVRHDDNLPGQVSNCIWINKIVWKGDLYVFLLQSACGCQSPIPGCVTDPGKPNGSGPLANICNVRLRDQDTRLFQTGNMNGITGCVESRSQSLQWMIRRTQPWADLLLIDKIWAGIMRRLNGWKDDPRIRKGMKLIHYRWNILRGNDWKDCCTLCWLALPAKAKLDPRVKDWGQIVYCTHLQLGISLSDLVPTSVPHKCRSDPHKSDYRRYW